MMPAKITALIHWQAVKLWLKRVPFHHKPPFEPGIGPFSFEVRFIVNDPLLPDNVYDFSISGEGNEAVAALLAWGAVGLLFALRRFRWAPWGRSSSRWVTGRCSGSRTPPRRSWPLSISWTERGRRGSLPPEPVLRPGRSFCGMWTVSVARSTRRRV